MQASFLPWRERARQAKGRWCRAFTKFEWIRCPGQRSNAHLDPTAVALPVCALLWLQEPLPSLPGVCWDAISLKLAVLIPASGRGGAHTGSEERLALEATYRLCFILQPATTKRGNKHGSERRSPTTPCRGVRVSQKASPASCFHLCLRATGRSLPSLNQRNVSLLGNKTRRSNHASHS